MAISVNKYFSCGCWGLYFVWLHGISLYFAGYTLFYQLWSFFTNFAYSIWATYLDGFQEIVHTGWLVGLSIFTFSSPFYKYVNIVCTCQKTLANSQHFRLKDVFTYLATNAHSSIIQSKSQILAIIRPAKWLIKLGSYQIWTYIW